MTPAPSLQAVLQMRPATLPKALRVVLVVLALLGLAGLIAGLAVGKASWSVTALLVATLVTIGVSQAGIVWSAVFQITNSRWGRSYKRLLELTLAAAPLALLGLLILLATAGSWAPFAGVRFEGGKAVWLSLPFWAIRNFAAVLGLTLLSAHYLYHCLRPDLGIAMEQGQPYPGLLADWITRGWQGAQIETERSQRRRAVLAPILCIGCALVDTLLGFDLVMALDPGWTSTLFGAYHFIGNIYLGLALAILLAAALRKRIGPPEFLSPKHFGLMGTLLFAFCMVMGDFFWSQFLTIWYGNIPEEAEYVLLRTMDPEFPWRYLAWAVLAGFFFIPFVSLLFKAIKWVPGRVSLVAAVVLLAIVGERFLTAAPPLLRLQAGAGLDEMLIPLALAILATLGFIAGGGLMAGWLLTRVPAMPISDPLWPDSLLDSSERT